MKTSNLLMALMAAAGLTLAGAAQAATAPSRDAMATKPASTMTKDARDQAYKDASAQYKADKDACKAMTGNAKDICMEEAKGKEKMAKADADAAYKGTPKAFKMSRERCICSTKASPRISPRSFTIGFFLFSRLHFRRRWSPIAPSIS